MTIKSIIPKMIEQLDPLLELEKILIFEENELHFGQHRINLKKQKLSIISIGKSATPMLKAVCTLFERNKVLGMIKKGIVLDHLFDCVEEWKIPVLKLQGDHPIPKDHTFFATQKIIEYLVQIKTDEVCLFLISGGTSALLELPQKSISFDEFESRTASLFKKGLPIEDLNRERNLLSQIKQGRLLNFVKTDHIYNLIINDTPNENDQVVGSGPTFGERALSINWDNRSKLRVRLELVLPEIHWELEEATLNWNELIQKAVALKKEKVGYIGEITLAIPHQIGRGGRNTHFTAYLLDRISKGNAFLKSFLSLATDGSDGASHSAGAFFDLKKAIDLSGLEQSLATFDSASWLEQKSLLIPAFKSPTNLMDIRVYFF